MADVQVKYTSDMQKLLRDQDKQLQKHEATIKKLQDTVRASKKTGDASSGAMKKTERATTTLNQAIGRLSTLSFPAMAAAGLAAARKIIAPLLEVKAAIDAAGASIDESFDKSAALASLAAGDPAKFRSLRSREASLFAAGAGRTRGEAGELLFALESAGITGQDKLFAKIQGAKAIPDVPTLIRGAASLQTAFGVKETGAVPGVLSKIIALSAYSPSFPAEIADAAAKAGGTAAKLGFSDEELLAATTIASKVGGADVAGTNINALLTQISKQPELQKGSLGETIASLFKLSSTEQFETLKEIRAVKGVNVVGENIKLYNQALAQITESQTQDLIGQTVDLVKTDPTLSSNLAERIEDNRTALSMEAFGSLDNQLDAVRKRLYRKRIEADRPTGGIANQLLGNIEGAASETIQTVIGTPAALRMNQRAFGGELSANVPAPTMTERIVQFNLITQAAELLMRAGATQLKAAEAASRQTRPNNKPAARQVPSMATE